MDLVFEALLLVCELLDDLREEILNPTACRLINNVAREGGEGLVLQPKDEAKHGGSKELLLLQLGIVRQGVKKCAFEGEFVVASHQH